MIFFALSISFWCKIYAGQALEMMKVNSDLATAKNRFNDTALHVLARKHSAFVSKSQQGILRRHIDSCELFQLNFWMNGMIFIDKQNSTSIQCTLHITYSSY